MLRRDATISAKVSSELFTAGVWATTPQAILGPAIRQLACYKDGNDVVCLGSNPTNVWKVRDVNHALPTSATALTSIGGAPTNTVFRGVALVAKTR